MSERFAGAGGAGAGQALEVGAVIAETYEVTRLLGRGGMGSVWEASHLRLPGKRVAIKVLHADVAGDPEALARFRREAEIASRLGHPNIVEVHDFNTLPGGQPYLVLELLRGESLDARLRRGPMPVEQAMRIAGQVALALTAAHREQVIHRDLKPHNIFLVQRPEETGGELVKVLDFGISKIRGSQTVKTQDSTILGTPQYMAPEQATGAHAAVDPRTDVFALGAIAYEMLAGRPAFTGESIPEVVFKVVYEDPPPLEKLAPGLPARIAEAVTRALAKKQDERFADVAGFVEAMAGMSLSALRQQPILGPPVAPPPPAAPAGAAEALAATLDSGSRARESIPAPAAAPPSSPKAAPPVSPSPPVQAPAPAAPRRWFALAGAGTLLVGAAAAALIALGTGDRAGSAPSSTVAISSESARAAGSGAGAEVASSDPSAADEPEVKVAADAETEAGDEPETGQLTALAAGTSTAGGAGAIGSTGSTAGSGTGSGAVASTGAAASTGTSGGNGGTRPAEPEADAEAAVPARHRRGLAEIKQALAASDYRRAVFLADKAIRDGAGPAAHAARARAFCGLQDLGNATASMRQVPRRHRALRRQVAAYCRRKQVELED